MNWQATGAISGIVGAAGVIATLLYLANQLTLNTLSNRAVVAESWAFNSANTIPEMKYAALVDKEVAKLPRRGP